MDSFENPQLFQNSSIVQKSSKTGIFSNKRLLVIKSGYLYYFSKVPKGYKSHVPNILTTFTDLPKSSIEIKNILEIRLESAKSSCLIIKFYLKDMIDRQDIRKSIDTHSYLAPQKKTTPQMDQWKFMFTTVLQCRLWFNALMKLKQYFKGLQNTFKDFVASFDPKRTSVSDSKDGRSQSDLKFLMTKTKQQQTNEGSNMAKSQQPRKTQPIKFDASKFLSVRSQDSSPKSSKSSELQMKQDSNQERKPQKQSNSMTSSPKANVLQSKVQKVNLNSVINEEEESEEKGQHPNISHEIEPQILQIHSDKLQKVESFKSTLKESHLIEPINEEEEIKIKQMEEQIREEVEEEIREKLQKEKKQELQKYKSEMEMKELRIKQLEKQLHINHLTNMQKQKTIEQQKRQLQNKIMHQQQKLSEYQARMERQLQQQLKQKQKMKSQLQSKQKKQENFHKEEAQKNQRKWIEQGDQYQLREQPAPNFLKEDQIHEDRHRKNQSHTNPTFGNSVEVNQFSVQTDEQELNQSAEFDHHNFSKDLNISKELSYSKDLNLSKQTKIRNSFFSDCMGSNRNTILQERFRIEDSNLVELNKEEEVFKSYQYFSELSRLFEPNISSGQKIQRQVLLQRYIKFVKDQTTQIASEYIDFNKPRNCVSFEKGQFTFEVACAPGKIMNIGGSKNLIYSNKVHENLKRTFKIYQYMQVEILKLLKTKPHFPVRTPLCTLIQYKGYTVLAKLQLCCDEKDMSNKEKYLKHLISSEWFSHLKLTKTLEQNLLMVKVLKSFKITSSGKNSEIFKSDGNVFAFINHISRCRKLNISVCSEKLKNQYKQFVEEKQKSEGDEKEHSFQDQASAWKLIRVMRELKKLLKTFEPYSQQKGQTKSQFVETLLSKPNQLLALIPSQFDFSDLNTKSGFFYSLLEYFLGIRINTPINLNTMQNLSYEFIPVVRAFQMTPLISYQYCQKMQKYLSLSSIESSENCHKLIKRIHQGEIQARFSQIRLLLKKKQYQIAEEKIYQLRDCLPLHDLRNIEINAYLIQSYVFMGLEAEALTQIKSSLEYAEYMFGNKSNVYEQNLHLLMAQTLLKMGNINQAIRMFESLLKQKKINKDLILISFAEAFKNESTLDPNQIIPFLVEFSEEVKSPQKKIQVYVSIGKLYLKVQRKDKGLFYTKKAYQMSLNSDSLGEILQIYDLLLETLKEENSKQVQFKELIQSMDPEFFLSSQNCKDLNTINLYHILMAKQEPEQWMFAQLVKNIELSKDEITQSSTAALKSWTVLKDCIDNALISSEDIRDSQINRFANIFDSINIKLLIKKINNKHKRCIQ